MVIWQKMGHFCVGLLGQVSALRSRSMSRDHRKLRVFQQADTLVLMAYRLTSALPAEERFGLQAQIRRAAVSVATNLVEGSSRVTTAEYRRFVEIAHGSAREAGYLLDLTMRLRLLPETATQHATKEYETLSSGLAALIRGLTGMR